MSGPSITPAFIHEHWPTIATLFAKEGITITEGQALAVLADFAAVVANPPDPRPTPVAADAIDPYALHILGNSPDVRAWPITTRLEEVEFSEHGCRVKFDTQASWPMVVPPAWTGGIQYTLWVLQPIAGVWYAVGCMEYWEGLVYQGGGSGELRDADTQLRRNWYYYAEPMASTRLDDGADIGFMVTAGDARRKDVHQVAERSNIVVVPFKSAPSTWATPGA